MIFRIYEYNPTEELSGKGIGGFHLFDTIGSYHKWHLLEKKGMIIYQRKFSHLPFNSVYVGHL